MRVQLLVLILLLLILSTNFAYATLHGTGFVDIPANAWHAPAVAYCVNNQLMTGVSKTTFSPNVATSRGMLATILYRRAGSPDIHSNMAPFSDIDADSWYTKAITWAKESNVITGYGDGSFLPNHPVTREQLATILWRYEGEKNTGSNYQRFSDHSEIENYALNAVYWAKIQGVISGRGNNFFDPKGVATRAETASILYRCFENNTLWEEDSQPEGREEMIVASITVGSKVFSVKIYNNESAQAIVSQMPFTLKMEDFSRQEKVAPLSFDLPSATTEIPSRINAGEIYLWSENQMVLFYTSSASNSYGYVPIGYIEDTAGLAETIGSGNVAITFSIK